METRRPTYRVYQEPGRSVFTHDGQRYNLNALLQVMQSRPIIDVYVSDLVWILKHDRPNPNRVKKAHLSKPILVTHWNGKLVVVDGLHRLEKARLSGVERLPAKIVLKKDLSAVLLDGESYVK